MMEISNQMETEFLTKIDTLLTRNFLNTLNQYQIVPMVEYDIEDSCYLNDVRFVKMEKIVLNTEGNYKDRLLNLYNAISDCKGSVIMTICSDGETVEIFLGVKCEDNNYLHSCKEVMEGILKGSFPGTMINQVKDNPLTRYENQIKKVAVVSGIPGAYEQNEQEYIGKIENIVEGMRGRKYCFVIIADYVEQETLYRIRNEYEELYTQISLLGEITYNYQESETKSKAESLTESITDTLSKSLSETATRSFSVGQANGLVQGNNVNASVLVVGGGRQSSESSTYSYTDLVSDGITRGESVSRGKTDARGETLTTSDSRSNSIQLKLDNKRIKDILVKLDRQIERIDDALNTGLWETATYCMAQDDFTCQIASSMMKSAFSGNKNSVEGFHSYIWNEKQHSDLVKKYIMSFRHPILKDKAFFFCPTSIINGVELVALAHLPQNSISGLETCRKVPFSRNIMHINSVKMDDKRCLELGNIYHFGITEKGRVRLDYDTLAGHTFICGTTGTGKTNAVIGILKDLEGKGIPYLVVEPVKGEYSNYLNAYKYDIEDTSLLQINPFSFPKRIHIYEHVDRILEILKVCWPMEAAMPDVLKSAILCAYEACGWDLEESSCPEPIIYPNFLDVLQQLRNVISQSEYSEEVKGNYVGALVSRVKSMTNGVNGKVFNSKELSAEDLFKKNVIIDLSKIGASETKSLIMGIIVMKLNEYYLGLNTKTDRSLSHVLVLEEAHHLLKNPSTVVSMAGGNQIQQKSIELLSNSICEMRFYGEGIIIADQSPEAVDASAVKNTNTKLIFRMPDCDDRNKIGKSCGLDEKQIQEIAKLETGVAVIYQGNWESAILCKIDKNKIIFESPTTNREGVCVREKKYRADILSFLLRERVNHKIEINRETLLQAIQGIVIAGRSRKILLRILKKWEIGVADSLLVYTNFKKLAKLIVSILDCEERLIFYAEYLYDFEELDELLKYEIRKKVGFVNEELEKAIMQCILSVMYSNDLISKKKFEDWRVHIL